jgi:flagellar biosynthesis protein FliP
MTSVRRSLAVFLAVLLMAPMASAQNHVIGKAALDNAVQEKVSRDQADREAILSLLQRAEVRDIAAKAGLSLDKAPAAVSALQGSELAQAAAQARQVQNDLAGGASTVVISTTTIIIILLLILLIVVIAD